MVWRCWDRCGSDGGVSSRTKKWEVYGAENTCAKWKDPLLVSSQEWIVYRWLIHRTSRMKKFSFTMDPHAAVGPEYPQWRGGQTQFRGGGQSRKRARQKRFYNHLQSK